jgi:hypothetical protein
MGDNWPERKPAMKIDFSGFVLKMIPMCVNSPNSDSCVEWDDGFVTVLRDENGPTFQADPPRLGLARVGDGKKDRKTDGNRGKSAKSTRKGRK